MRQSDSKLECNFIFCSGNSSKVESRKYSGLFHLFECRYDSETFFWFGVAEVNCRSEDIIAIQERGLPTDFSVTVFLSDGRIGGCRLLNSHFEGCETSQHTAMALIGWTELSLPSESTGDAN
jgi:hypothetical protein